MSQAEPGASGARSRNEGRAEAGWMVSVVLNSTSNKTNKIPKFYDTAIPQPEETEVLKGLLQRDRGETCAEAIAAFVIGIFFLG